MRVHIYGDRASFEIELPTTDLQNWSFTLEKSLFGLRRDYRILMTVLDGRWCFASSSEYRVLRNGESHFERYLKLGDLLAIQLESADGIVSALLSDTPNKVGSIPKYILDRKAESVAIGSSASCEIVLSGVPLIAATYAILEARSGQAGGSWYLVPNSTCYVNGCAVHSERKLEFGDVVDFYGCRMIFLGELLALDAPRYPGASVRVVLQVADNKTIKWLANLSLKTEKQKDEKFYRPAPRALPEYEVEELEIEGPPAPRQVKERSFLSVIGPSLTMVLPMLIGVALTGMGNGVAGLIMMGGSAIGMAVWGAKNLHDQKKEAKEEEKKRQDKYRAYLVKRETELEESEEFNKQELLRAYPSATFCLDCSIEDGELWGRNPNQDDYLVIRLGTGEAETLRPVKIPPDRFSLIDDDLSDEPARIKGRFEKITGAPLGIDLSRFGVFGLIGGDSKSGCYPIARVLLAQIAANYRYTDVKVVLLCDGSRAEDRRLLESAKWLPHMWSDDYSIRYAGDSPASAKEVLNVLMPMLRERWEASRDGSQVIQGVRYVFFCTDRDLLAESIAAVYLTDAAADLCTNVFLFAEKQSGLPNSCEFMISNTPEFMGTYTVSDARKNWRDIRFDEVSADKLEAFSHKVAAVKIHVPDTQREIPEMVTFLGMYGVELVGELNVFERWRTSTSFNEIGAPIGVSADNMPCGLDIHERAHGPHGLVAGTTGSGKSETLMTWILSLAVNYSPEDVSFLLVDFKGGGLANQFDNAANRLPHLAGTITNLGGSQIHRALVSIKSENERRQRLLADTNANDIYDYTKLYKNREVDRPLPHLVIVVDEFAELKKQFPDFMSELVSVAAIGRSLGVHLVLATQKPSGVVDDKISSNSRFRICLKVQTPQDSKDMLQRNDAAFITQKGRGILRVGNDEMFQMFQSAWSRAPYPADPLANHADVARLISVTGQTQIVGTYHAAMRKKQEATAWVGHLAGATKKALRLAKTTTQAYLSDPRTVRKVNDVLYEIFAEQSWNIARNDGNDERLINLVRIYDMCKSQVGGDDVDPAQMLELAKNYGVALPEKATSTQLDSVLAELQAVALEHDLTLRDRLWLPELPEFLTLADVIASGLPADYVKRPDIAPDTWTLETCIGLLDDPEHQYQAPVFVDFATSGNYAVVGASMTGKSTLVQGMLFTLMQRYAPNALNVYCIDFSGRKLECLSGAPHVGGMLFEEDVDLISKLFYLLDEMLASRKKMLHGMSFAQYSVMSDAPMPAVLLVVDNMGSFQERTLGAYDKQMLQLAKEGPSYGMYLVVTGADVGTGEIPPKLADAIKGRICLEMNNQYDYRDILNVSRCETLPCEGVPGRGLVVKNGVALEFQVVVPIAEDDDYQIGEKIRRACKRMRMEWAGPVAPQVPYIPEKPRLSEYLQLPEVVKLLEDYRSLPIGYDRTSARPVALDLSRIFCFIVSGKEHSGRKNFMPLLVEMAHRKGGDVHVFGAGGGPLRLASERCGARYYSDEHSYETFFDYLGDELLRRNKKKRALELAGHDDQEIYASMQDERAVYMIVEDLYSFAAGMYSPADGVRDVSNFFEVLCDKARYHQVFLFAGLNQSVSSSSKGTKFYTLAVRDKSGIHFGGNVVEQMLMEFDYLKAFSEKSKVEGPSVGLVSTSELYPDGGAVIVPEVDFGKANSVVADERAVVVEAEEVPHGQM